MRLTRMLSAIALLSLPLTAQAAEEHIFEMEPTRNVAQVPIGVCSNLHEILPVYCRSWHVIAVEIVFLRNGSTTPKTGGQLVVENESGKASFRVQWTGTNYHLDNGEVLLSKGNGETSLATLTDMATMKDRAVTGWTDTDGSGALSVNDSLTVDGRTVKIVDVRGVLGATAE
ncbi:hypothetical protein JYJ95_38460 [Corallococcus exiguus]|uniref:hypothetical protein n=1 Tax=Corallococcus exiguus TaxID=83462 RepID=UPI001A8E72C9|nr:hypothetical protein [Corallococcus exiguus]MBN8472422.1 hypothetical protein [Corallococcus exiguus]